MKPRKNALQAERTSFFCKNGLSLEVTPLVPLHKMFGYVWLYLAFQKGDAFSVFSVSEFSRHGDW